MAARTTVRATAQRIRRQLASAQRRELNFLNADIDDVTTTITFTNKIDHSLKAGAVLDIDTEQMRVTSVDPVNKSAVVMRGWLDTVASFHYTGDEIEIDPRFPLADIVDTMIDELNSWPPDLYAVDDATFALASDLPVDHLTYELPAQWSNLLSVLSVRRNSTADAITGQASTVWPTVKFRLQRGVNFNGAPNSGILLRLLDEIFWNGSLYVQVALPFDTSTFEMDTDLVADVGLAQSMLDIVTSGVKLRLMGDMENPRSARDAQDDIRSAQEVPPGSALNNMRSMFAMYLRRRGEEMNRLRALYPPRMD